VVKRIKYQDNNIQIFLIMKTKVRTAIFRGIIFLLLMLFVSPVVPAQQAYEFPYQNPSLTTEVRVNDLVGRMTLDEKISY
jgi:beta-glucosidase